jgi:hypothetical protein
VDTAQVVVSNVQGNRRNVIIKLLGEAVGEPGKPALAHAERQILPFNVAGRNILIQVAAYYLTGYCYYGGWRVPALSFLYEVRYRIRLYDHTMRGAVAKRVADRIAIGQKAIRRNLGLADHALAQVVQKFQGRIGVPLADAPADDRLLRSGLPMKTY